MVIMVSEAKGIPKIEFSILEFSPVYGEKVTVGNLAKIIGLNA